MFSEIYLTEIRDLLDKRNIVTQINQSYWYRPTCRIVNNANQIFGLF
jgi:hypothetical protein